MAGLHQLLRLCGAVGKGLWSHLTLSPPLDCCCLLAPALFHPVSRLPAVTALVPQLVGAWGSLSCRDSELDSRVLGTTSIPAPRDPCALWEPS